MRNVSEETLFPAEPVTFSRTSEHYRWLALSCTSLGTLMATMNNGTLIIALPSLMKSLNTGLFTLVWVLLAYMLVQTVLVVTAGKIADMVGRKRLYVTGFAVFGAAALAAGFASSGWELIVTRAIQGAAGAFMLANSAAIVTDAFPKRQLGLALGTNMIVASVGIIAGTILGGWLTEFGWQWVFWFNVPISLLGSVWAALNLRELSQLDRNQGHDFPGTVAYVFAMGGLLVALTAGGIQGWGSPIVIAGFIATAIALPLFIYIESRSPAPMMDFSLFRHRAFSLGNIAVFFNAMARMGVTFLFVFYYQGPKGLDPVTAGLLLAPIAGAMLVVSPLSGWLADRRGSQGLSIAGLALNTVGLGAMAFIDLSTPAWYIVLTMVVLGMGAGFFNSPNTRLIMTSVPPIRRGIGAGVRTMLMNSGGVVSIALVLAIITSGIDPKSLFAIFTGVTSGLPQRALNEFVGGFHAAFWILTGFSALSLLVSAVPMREREEDQG